MKQHNKQLLRKEQRKKSLKTGNKKLNGPNRPST